MFLNKLFINNINFLSKRFKWTSSKTKLYEKLFDTRFSKSSPIASVNLTEDQLEKSAMLCKTFGFSKQEWIQHPELFNNLLILENKYLILKEGGFSALNSEILVNFTACINKKVCLLKHCNLIPKEINVAESFVSNINLSETIKIDDLTDEHNFYDIFRTILLRYLTIKFNTKENVFLKRQKHIIRIYRSFELLEANFLLFKEIGIPLDKILQYEIATSTHYRASKKLIEETSKYPDLKFFDLFRRDPKLLKINSEYFVKIYGYLKKYNISDHTIRKYVKIFHHDPNTVLIRLKEIKSIPELSVVFDDQKTLKFISGYSQARSKLSFLNSKNFKCTPLAILSSTQKAFEDYITIGNDSNNQREMYSFLKYLLKTTDPKIPHELKKHRKLCLVPYTQIKETYKFIKTFFRFSDESIIAAIHILLYLRSDILDTYDKVLAKNPLEFQLSEVQVLNLIVYHIEKDFNFEGCAD